MRKYAVRVAGLLLVLVMFPSLAAAQYSVRRTGDTIQLEDAKNQITVSLATSVGNIAFEMKIKGQNVLHFPYASVEAFKSRPGLSGIPFLGPWANRLDETAFYANGKRHPFNMDLGNVRGRNPIHGFLSYTDQWKVVEAKADDHAAWVVSRLEFFRQPNWMAQFPFAHTIEVTYRLQSGVVEVRTRIENLSADPMPVAIGFHPYFQLTDSTRDEWTIDVGARTEWLLGTDKIPTGETRPIEQLFSDPKAAKLKDYNLDHVFGDLIRDAEGRARLSVLGKAQKLDVLFGKNYRAAVIYAPSTAQDRNFICFEPMAGITNAMNLQQKGLYRELQTIPPGQIWQESFWIQPSGF